MKHMLLASEDQVGQFVRYRVFALAPLLSNLRVRRTTNPEGIEMAAGAVTQRGASTASRSMVGYQRPASLTPRVRRGLPLAVGEREGERLSGFSGSRTCRSPALARPRALRVLHAGYGSNPRER